MNFTADLDLFLADFGVPVTAGAISGMAIYDQDSEIILNGDVVKLGHSIKVKTDLFGSLNYGDNVTVNGSYFSVEHEPMRSSDGAFSIVPLMKTLQQSLTAVFTFDVFEAGVFTA